MLDTYTYDMVAVCYAARHRNRLSVAVVVHRIAVPAEVTPVAPVDEQNAPGETVAPDGGETTTGACVVVGASVTGTRVVGAAVVGASVVGAAVVGAAVVGACVVGAAVVGAAVVGACSVGAAVVGTVVASVTGAGVTRVVDATLAFTAVVEDVPDTVTASAPTISPNPPPNLGGPKNSRITPPNL